MFSQNDEEKYILEFFGSEVGCFLDIGAYDGVEFSNTRALAVKGWQGMLVEPSPMAFRKLIQNTRTIPGLHLVNALVYGSSKWLKFYYEENRGWGSTTRKWLVDFCKMEILAEVWVRSVSPSDIADLADELHLKFDFVSIDTEGDDFEILMSASRLLRECRLLCVENARRDWSNDFRSLGFNRIIAQTRQNIIVTR